MEIKKLGVIGAGQMGNGIAHVAAQSGLDVVMHDDELEVRLTEMRLGAGSPFIDRSLEDCALSERTGTTVLALRRNGRFVTNPRPDAVLQSGDVVIALGTPEQVDALQSLTH